MFKKGSRYFRLDDVFVADSDGRVRASKEIRRIPPTGGQFIHTLAEGERVDQLAFKYYKEPGRWWRICDANPQFMSPRLLLGSDPWETAHIPARALGAASWVQLLADLERRVGVESALLEEQFSLVTDQQLSDGELVDVTTELCERTVRVRYNRLNLGAQEIADHIEAAGFEVGEPRVAGRVGRPIVIPPDGAKGG